MNYKEVAYEVMKLMLDDFTEEELKSCIDRAYDSKFDTEEMTPLVKVENEYFLELSMELANSLRIWHFLYFHIFLQLLQRRTMLRMKLSFLQLHQEIQERLL